MKWSDPLFDLWSVVLTALVIVTVGMGALVVLSALPESLDFVFIVLSVVFFVLTRAKARTGGVL